MSTHPKKMPVEQTQKVARIIVGRFHRVAGPLYLGIVAGYIGWSLARTQEVFDILEDDKIIRPMTVEEKKAQKIREDGIVYVLIEEPQAAKAGW